MAYAVTHMLVAIVAVELFRKFVVKNNKIFPRYYILVAAIAGLIPDLDIAAYYVLYFFGFTLEQVHRTFMHSAFIPLGLSLIGLFIYKTGIRHPELRKRHLKLSTIFFIFAIGTIIHLILDMIYGKIPPLYPFIQTTIGLGLLHKFPKALQELISATIDGILFLGWLMWLQFKLKIDNYF
ncbi:MAG: metal-dependent hydrolase [Nanoarchaeota archaeon]